MSVKVWETKDVTDQVGFDSCWIDGEWLPFTQCICGATFNYGEFTMGMETCTAHKCPKCGRAFVFELNVKVMEVTEL